MRGKRVQSLFHCREKRDVIVNGKDCNGLIVIVAQVDGRRFENLAIFSLSKVGVGIMEFSRIGVKRLEHYV